MHNIAGITSGCDYWRNQAITQLCAVCSSFSRYGQKPLLRPDNSDPFDSVVCKSWLSQLSLNEGIGNLSVPQSTIKSIVNNPDLSSRAR
jgi:hypothetical protein